VQQPHPKKGHRKPPSHRLMGRLKLPAYDHSDR
jgi:hypothetical protein